MSELRRWFYALRAVLEGPAGRRYRREFGREAFTPEKVREMTAWAEAQRDER